MTTSECLRKLFDILRLPTLTCCKRSPMLPRLALTFALAAMLCTVRATGQTLPPTQTQADAEFDAPAYIAVIDGAATLERDGRIESAPLNMPLVSGDRLRTTDGRVEVRYADGGRLFVD